ncbi:MAG TPA: GtrA family protein [Dongiaceae bacterium]|nr:GtrA family protein [Dongiaceae bacterium]
MKQFGKFLAVGVVNTAIGYIVIFSCMYGLGWGPFLSNVAGYAVGLSVSYLLNRVFTFKSSRAKTPEAAAFLGIFCLAYGANLGILKLLIDNGQSAGSSQIIAGVIYTAVSYLANKFLVFRHVEPTS